MDGMFRLFTNFKKADFDPSRCRSSAFYSLTYDSISSIFGIKEQSALSSQLNI